MTAEAKFYYFGKYANVLIKDSYSLISTTLKKFQKMFNINVKKEILPYRLYNDNNVKIGFIDKDICIEEVKYQYECNNIGEDFNTDLSKENKDTTSILGMRHSSRANKVSFVFPITATLCI